MTSGVDQEASINYDQEVAAYRKTLIQDGADAEFDGLRVKLAHNNRQIDAVGTKIQNVHFILSYFKYFFITPIIDKR